MQWLFNNPGDLDQKVGLEVEGTIPQALEGQVFLQNGFGKQKVGNTHLFDGLAHLVGWYFEKNGGVSLLHRHLNTRVSSSDNVNSLEYGAVPKHLSTRLASIFWKPSDNTTISTELMHGEIYALTESPITHKVDLETLTSKGSHKGRVWKHHTTAHFHRDGNDFYNVSTHFGRTNTVKITRTRDGVERTISSYKENEPSYMHSILGTQNYIVLVEQPFVFHPLSDLRDYVLHAKSIPQSLHWKPEKGTRLTFVHKETGEITRADTDPFFSFHGINAYEKEGGFVVDVIAFDSHEVTDALYLDNLANFKRLALGGTFRRIHVDGTNTHTEVFPEVPMEMPRVTPSEIGRPYSTVYGMDKAQNHEGRIVSFSPGTRNTNNYSVDGSYPSEPIVFESAQGSYLLCSMHGEEKTELHILTANSLEQVAVARYDNPLPMRTHGGIYQR